MVERASPIGGRPRLTIAVPVFNVAPELIEEAVGSALRLRLPIEVVLVDDGSTRREVVACVDRLASSDPRVRLLRQENRGLNGARNTALRAARGEWLTILDPDDRVASAAADVLHGLAPDVDVLLASAGGFAASGTGTEAYDLTGFPERPDPATVVADLLAIFNHGRESSSFLVAVTWAKVFRVDFLRGSGLWFDETLVKREDAEWMLRVLHATDRIAVSHSRFVDYRYGVAGSGSRRYDERIVAGHVEIGRRLDGFSTVSAELRQLYKVELIKDAINAVFTHPDAPRRMHGRDAYLAFRDELSVDLPLWRLGALQGAPLSRRLLYVVIRRRWHGPLRVLTLGRRLARRTRRSC
ncbi:glycosyltransferase family 2 protein [Nocardioides nitrophenolicus]|uniref:glycosyltransferase family 2 protein n=1 Tax=Nocardioides nitrophenolicus TaxID=60489 RepID=UPI0019598CEA|nr:glycosyltransferase [Nocardioides nitrophenolicus]MBM7518712.1 glycosyltransferase involved in cell wall biosynthesis [Nocardioides nitrophenolicus]